MRLFFKIEIFNTVYKNSNELIEESLIENFINNYEIELTKEITKIENFINYFNKQYWLAA